MEITAMRPVLSLSSHSKFSLVPCGCMMPARGEGAWGEPEVPLPIKQNPQNTSGAQH